MSVFDEEVGPDPETPEGLLELLEAQASLLVAVATGGPQIDTVNAAYQRRRRKLDAGLTQRGIARPFPFDDLWAWYGHYSPNMRTYAERRAHISRLASPVREALEAMLAGVQVSDPGGTVPETWALLDARVDEVATELRAATTLDGLQDVGRRCREILIGVGRLLADESLVPDGQVGPQAGNAKAWLELFLAARADGRSHRELRAFIPVAWDLAQKVTHGDIERVDAFAAAQATVLIVRTLQQLAAA